MIDGYLVCCDGRQLQLPDLLSWRLEYTAGVPCDSFTLQCLWTPGAEEALSAATRFFATADGARVFTGVVDEYELLWDGGGGRLNLSGRGMAALLLDNEAVGADYQVATLADILRDQVTPYGITVGEQAALPAVTGFSVAGGRSAWQALYEFARYYGGITPRFDRAGELVLAPWHDGAPLVLDGKIPVTEIAYREKRYGVLSEILVRDRTSKTVQRVVNEAFRARGGRCSRVLTLPRKSSYQTMRYSGQYQLDRSAAGLLQVVLRVPIAFFAAPGDLITLALVQPKLDGLWRVFEAATGVDADGAYTRITLGPPGAAV